MFRRFTIMLFLGGFFIFTLSAHAASFVVINEIQTGNTDADDEFIELWNGSDTAIVLEDWSIQYKTATGTTMNKRNFEKGASIPAQGYYLIATKTYTGSVTPDLTQSSVSLAKSGGNLYLVRNQEIVTSKDDPDIVDRVAWGTGDSAEGSAAEAPDAGQSITRADAADTNNNAKDFSIQITPTPSNTKTVVTGSKTPPASSQTIIPSTETSTTTPTPKKESVKEEKGVLSITELLPNPVGSDEREFIELQNTGTAAIELAGWRITNRLEQEYHFEEGVLAPKAYYLLTREKSRLALQNDREEIRLFAPNKDRATEVIKFTDAREGFTLMRDENDDLVWTTTPTPGEQNRLMKEQRAPHAILHAPKEGSVGDLLSFDASDSFDPQGEALTFHWNFGDDLGSADQNQANYIYLKPGTFTITLTAINKEGLSATETQKIKIVGEDLLAEKIEQEELPEAKKLESPKSKIVRAVPNTDVGEKTITAGTIRGVVTVPPGVLAKTYMFIQCEMPCAGKSMKVRMTKADWPAIQKGNVITISGKMTTTGNEPSFLTRKEWIHVTGEQKRVVLEPITTRDITDILLHHFVSITGEVTEKKSLLLYLDDGEGEIPIQIKSSTKLIAEGDHVTATGILIKNQNGWRLNASEPIQVVSAQTKKPAEPARIVRDKNAERTKYLVTTLAALIALGAQPIWSFAHRRFTKTEGGDQPKGDQEA